jgi:hypothetical protein
MPRLLTLYSVIYVVFLSNTQQLIKNKRHNLLFIWKFKKHYKLVKYQLAHWIISKY